MNRSPILFIHIPKTAGTSLKTLLCTRIAKSAVLEIREGAEQGSRMTAHLDDFEFVSGHVGFGIMQAFQRPPSVITFLREPIDRALSAYYFIRQTTDSNLPSTYTELQRAQRREATKLVKELSLREFIHSHPAIAAAHLGNVQTLILSSPNGALKKCRSLGVEDLMRAQENLEKCLSFGLTERVEASMTMICHSLRWAPFAGFPHANPTHSRPAAADLDASTLDDLREFTQWDGELYRFATDLFEQRWRKLLAVQPTAGATSVEVQGDGESAFRFDRRIPGVGWYGSERMGDFWCSWTGPGTESSIDLKSPQCDQVLLRVSIAHALRSEALHQTQLLVNDAPLAARLRREGNVHHLEAAVPSAVLDRRGELARITIRTPFVLRPCDVDPNNADNRKLGVAVTSVSLLPAA